jgi:sugar lactone lactonase YvrE
MQWKIDDKSGKVVAGGHGKGDRLDQLNYPNRVLIDKKTNSLIISDRYNRRVVRWSLNDGTTNGENLIDNTYCSGLALDEQGYLYVSDTDNHEVRRYKIDDRDKTGTIVAGGNGKGSLLNQLHNPYYIFVDQAQNVYVSDYENYRVMKWEKNAKEGIIVAGGQGYGYALTQLAYPTGLFVDLLGTLYVAERRSWLGYGYTRIRRWPQGQNQGDIIVGTNEQGSRENEFDRPEDLKFDKDGNLYVVDCKNHRVQRFLRV